MLRRPCPVRGLNLRPVVWKCDAQPLSHRTVLPLRCASATYHSESEQWQLGVSERLCLALSSQGIYTNSAINVAFVKYGSNNGANEKLESINLSVKTN
ncbi:hypothetical protein TNCV_4967941 [Trichonephila clavipes]|nr:hypothetical protein TNCV_4967941 [Trichonephila clavipes]